MSTEISIPTLADGLRSFAQADEREDSVIDDALNEAADAIDALTARTTLPLGETPESIDRMLVEVGDKVGKITTPTIIAIDTLEGTMEAEPGDWIIRGTEGEFYPCKPAAFAATFEEVTS